MNPLELLSNYPCYAVLLLIILGLFLLSWYQKTKINSWRTLAARNSLNFRPAAQFFSGEAAEVSGHYRGRKLKLSYFWRSYGWGDRPNLYSYLTLSIKNHANNCLFLRDRVIGRELIDNLRGDKSLSIGNKQFEARFVIKGSPSHFVTKLLGSSQLQQRLQQVQLGKEAKIKLSDQELCYEQFGIESNIEYLEFLLELLSDLAEEVENWDR